MLWLINATVSSRQTVLVPRAACDVSVGPEARRPEIRHLCSPGTLVYPTT